MEQVKKLSAEADAFENRDAYVFRTEAESRSTHEITYRSFAVEREPPPEEWPLLAGEAIQNLRAALDHIVYAASGGAKEDEGSSPTPASSNRRRPECFKGCPSR